MKQLSKHGRTSKSYCSNHAQGLLALASRASWRCATVFIFYGSCTVNLEIIPPCFVLFFRSCKELCRKFLFLYPIQSKHWWETILWNFILLWVFLCGQQWYVTSISLYEQGLEGLDKFSCNAGSSHIKGFHVHANIKMTETGIARQF
jgi:hypothetical protein